MRRWWTAAGVAMATVFALAGCGGPAGVDGELVDDWHALPAAKLFVPEAGTCHPTIQSVGYLSGYNPVDCAASHRSETLHLGTVTGPAADRSTPPAAGSEGVRTARAECDQQVSKAVGADWRSGRLLLSVIFPSPSAWTGGARWFRCDVSEVKSIDDGTISARTGSLRDALKPGSPLAYGCFDPKVSGGSVEDMRGVACTAKHRAEFVGIYQFPNVPYAEWRSSAQRAHKACRSLIAKYVKVPDNSDMQYRSGTIVYHPFGEKEWKDGNRGVQCFLWLSDRQLTRSLKGGGSKALPVR
jgi:hypothetical protein